MRFLGCLLLVALVGSGGCASKPPQNAAALSMHLVASPAVPPMKRVTVVLRTPALSMEVNALPVLTTADLEHAELKGQDESFTLRLIFNTHGTIELDRISNNNRDELLVIFINSRPVAAPQLKQRIVDGVFEFTPDMTLEEAQQAVEGLNATIAYLRKRPY